MNSEFVKENIRPLRGGRNPAQLEVASQAQNNEELQNALQQQQREYYKAIETYQGEDPLAVWYEFISWIEQSYPKSGRDGNLAQVLEECIKLFEQDQRYTNDRRFCKIWIKFIDMQCNALEIFHMVHARRLCVGCADLYRAWALHHELAGDYRAARVVFETARREMAQPQHEIDAAYETMVVNAAHHSMGIVNSAHIEEQRQALTQLSTYRAGVVGSIRVPSGNAVVLPSIGEHSNNHRQIMVPITDGGSGDHFVAGVGMSDNAAASVLSLVERNAPNENIKTPGVWNVPAHKNHQQHNHKACEFQVFEEIIVPEQRGIQLPEGYPQYTEENFEDFDLALCHPDPPDDKKIAMYPKHKVYEIHNVEFSLEELRGRHFKMEMRLRLPDHFITQTSENFDDWHRPLYDFEPENNQMPMYPKAVVYQFCDEEFSMEEIRSRPYFKTLEKPEEELETPLFIGEPYDRNVIPMYPKQLVYEVANIEFSLEEIRARTYIKPQSQLNMMEQDQSNHSIDMQIVNNSNSNFGTPIKGAVMESPRKCFEAIDGQNSFQSSASTSFRDSIKSFQLPITIPVQVPNQPTHDIGTPMEVVTPSPKLNNSIGFTMEDIWGSTPSFEGIPPPRIVPKKAPLIARKQLLVSNDRSPMTKSDTHVSFHPFSSPSDCAPAHVVLPPARVPFHIPEMDDATMSSPIKLDSRHNHHMPHQIATGLQQRGISMRTPLRDRLLTDEELAETGSRSGLDQPDVEHQASGGGQSVQDLMDSSKTFFMNVTNSNTSTPQHPPKQRPHRNLTTINEMSKECGSQGESNNWSQLHQQPKRESAFARVAEETNYEKNLAANSQANAELRSSLLNLFGGSQTEEPTPVVASPKVPIMQPQKLFTINDSPKPISSAPSDPFKAAVITNLLSQVKFPGEHADSYIEIFTTPRIAVRKDLCHIGSDRYLVEKCLGKGTFGSVFKAMRHKDSVVIALKFQKPANKWEYYICKEIQMRLANNPIRQHYMEVFFGYFSDQASVLVSEFNPYGSLLDVANTIKQKTGKVMPECLVMFFCIEMLRLVHTLHQIKIIHADIKPDNFLVLLINDQVSLQLIDFGCSIDMSLFPPGTLFTRPITTENFICCEMRDGRSWSYHTDLFCVAASAHALLFDKYIELQKKGGMTWTLTQRFARYLKMDLWNTFFEATLNQLNGPADVDKLLAYFRETMNSIDVGTRNDSMRMLKNIILKR